eukprot:scaffold130055_cov63-Phaeocystis_antarctica.AAC.5
MVRARGEDGATAATSSSSWSASGVQRMGARSATPDPQPITPLASGGGRQATTRCPPGAHPVPTRCPPGAGQGWASGGGRTSGEASAKVVWSQSTLPMVIACSSSPRISAGGLTETCVHGHGARHVA